MAGKVFMTGDKHGPQRVSGARQDGFVNCLQRKHFPEQAELDREDIVGIAGDFGAVWDYSPLYVPEKIRFIPCNQTQQKTFPHGESPEEKYWLDWLERQPFTTVAVGGNHENYDRIRLAYPHVNFKGGKAAKLRDHVYILDNGYIFNFGTNENPYTVFAFGGARSHDVMDGILDPEQIAEKTESIEQRKKIYRNERRRLGRTQTFCRIRHVSWWPQEEPSEEERIRGMKALQNCDDRVDLILTHEVPQSLYEQPDVPKKEEWTKPYKTGPLMYELDDADGAGLRQYLDMLMKRINYGCWIAGHYHVNKEYHIKSREMILYDQIVRVH